MVHEIPPTLVPPFPLHQVPRVSSPVAGADLVHEIPLALIPPFPLHQVPPFLRPWSAPSWCTKSRRPLYLRFLCTKSPAFFRPWPAPTWCTKSRWPLYLRSLCTKSPAFLRPWPAPSWCTKSRRPLFLRSLCTKSPAFFRPWPDERGALPPASPCFSVLGHHVPGAQTKSDARKAPTRLRASLFLHYIFKRKELTTNTTRPPFVVNSNHLPVPLAPTCIRHHKKLTTDSRIRKICRQSNYFSIFFTLIQVESVPEITSSEPDFLLASPQLTISPGHSTLIFPTAAGN